MAIMNNLANNILLAMPGSNSPFERAVIYLCEHHDNGSVGLIINKPMEYPLGLVFDQLQIEPISIDLKQLPLLYGGPTQPERGFVIHKQIGNWRSSLILRKDVTITTSNDIIRAIAVNEGPQNVLVTLGYAGWIEEQLEKEILENTWLVCPFKPEILYDVPFEKRWEYAGASIGVNMLNISSDSGHA